MTTGRLLPIETLRDLHSAVVSAGLDRDALLEHIDRRLVAGLRKASSLGAQVLVDLAALNEIQALADGSVPLRTWLENARDLAEPRDEAAIFQQALDTLGGGTPRVKSAAPAASKEKARSTKSATAGSSQSTTSRGQMDTTDILIVTVLQDEYAAVLRSLANTRPVQGTTDDPNLYGWRTGTVARAQGGAYRVALALTGRAGTVSASQAVVRSVERWKPRYVLLVGIAGGLPREGCATGDVVVSTEIYGYEYGKLDGGFHPRPNWVYQVDRGLSNSAQAFSAANADWWGGAAPPPKVLFGPVASGEKVVDDPSEPSFAAVLRFWPKLQAVEMEGAGAAAAIDELQSVGRQVGFLMVRGISDMPRPPGERAESAAQTGERDANKRRACEAAAAFVARWIADEWPVEPRSPHDPSEARRA